MKHSDRPIFRPSQDLLGRTKFSLALARSIKNLTHAKDGFVIAITGPWGSGKSSVIEMTLRHLVHLEMLDVLPDETSDTLEILAEVFDAVRPKVAAYEASNFDFAKSNYRYQSQLFNRWLASNALGQQAYKYWSFLQQIEADRKIIQVRFSPWLISGRAELATALLSELARTIGAKLDSDIKQAFALLLQRISEFAPVAAAGIDGISSIGIGKFLSAGGDWSGKAADRMTKGPTLDELRERLRSLLRSMNDQRLLVVIDDLDRLTPPEAAEMVSLVKSLGDLPNVIYLLSYDAKNLELLISKSTALDGHEFLKKIVQYPVHLPLIPRNGLNKILDAEIAGYLGDLDDESLKRIGATWYWVLRHYLTTPRDVRLFCNSFEVAFSSLKNYVDPVDLLILEALRLHEPAVYGWIMENLGDLVG